MKKIKVCMVVTNSLKKDPRVQREARAAYENGFEVIFIGQEDEFYDEKYLKNIPYKTDIIRISKKTRESRNLFTRLYRRIYRFWSFIAKILHHKPEVIHCNDLNTLLQGYIASKICGAKIVYDSHEVNCDILAENASFSDKIEIMKERYLITRVYQVVCVSNAAATVIADFYKIPKPLVVTNCSYRCTNVDFNQKKEGFKVLYHGIMSPDRGYEEFVQAAKMIDENIMLQLRGYGMSESLLRKMVVDNGIKNVAFEPPVEISELVIEASKSSVGVVLTKPVSTNYKYTVGNKIFEYINAGLPVILSDVPEHNYLNDRFNVGIVVEVTPEKIAEAIEKLYSDKKLYKQLRENAIKMSQSMCWENEVEKLLNVYRKIGDDFEKTSC